MRSARVKDILAAALLWSLGLATVAVLFWIIGDMAWRGAEAVFDLSYWTEAPTRAGRAGGIWPLLVSTVIVLGIGLLFAIPLGLACAIWLCEARPSFWVRLVRRALIVVAALPSLIMGVFGLVLFGELLGFGVSLLTGGLTVGVMVLPIFARGAEEGIRQVPRELKAGAAALGVGFLPTLRRIILPQAAPALGASLALAAGRILGESAALLLTAGPSLRMPESVLDQGRVLAYHIYLLAAEVPGGSPRSYAAAFALVLLVLLVDLGAGYLSERALHRSRDASQN